MKMKTQIIIAVIMTSLGVAGFAGAEEDKIPSMNVQTLKASKDTEKIILIDVGSILACRDARIPGSLCMPCDQQKAPSFFSSLTKDGKIVFYMANQPLEPDCSLIREAKSAGVSNIYALEGGLAAWRKAGHAVISDERIPRVISRAVKPENFPVWQKKAKNPFVIDIRSAKAFAAGHLEGALNFPLTRLHVQYADIPLDRTLLVVDDDGRASFLAASFLARKGFINVQRLQGGMAAIERGTR
jgi:rhodanese-related sulfurtransferase